MSAKTEIKEFAKSGMHFTTRDVAETLNLNISTVRKAISSLIEENELVRDENNVIQKKQRITREHSKKTISEILKPKFDAALEGVDIMIPPNATPEEKRARKATIKTALDAVTYGNTVAEIAACKGFSKYNEYHLDWYKSRYLSTRRKSAMTEQETELMAEAV